MSDNDPNSLNLDDYTPDPTAYGDPLAPVVPPPGLSIEFQEEGAPPPVVLAPPEPEDG